MADKQPAFTKKIGDLTYTTLEGTGIFKDSSNDDILAKAIESKRLFQAEDVPAAIRITNIKEGKSFIAIGFKREGDQEDLKVSVVKGPSGQVYVFDKPFTIHFDTKTNATTGEIKGTITNKSAQELNNKLEMHLNEKDFKDLLGHDKTRAAITSEKRYEVASVDAAPTASPATPSGKSGQNIALS